MTRKILLALMLAGLGCSESPSIKISESARENIQYLPAAASLVVYSNFEKLGSSSFINYIHEEFADDAAEKYSLEKYELIIDSLGFDPRKDLTDILLAVNIDRDISQPPFYAILHGAFDEDKLMTFVKNKMERDEKQELELNDITGHSIYIIKKDQLGFCFLNSSTLLVGYPKWIAQVAQGKVEENIEGRKDFMETLVEDVKYGEHFWVAVDTKVLADKMGEHPKKLTDELPPFETIKNIIFSANIDEAFRFHGKMMSTSAENGQVLVDLIKGAFAAAKLGAFQKPDIVEQLSKIEIYPEGNSAVLEGEISKEFLQSVQKDYNLLGAKK